MNTRTLDLTFAALLVATLITWLIGERGGHGPLAAATILILAGIKGWWVADEFMGLRHCAMHWRLIILLWLIVVVAAIGIAYYFGLH